WRSNHGALRDRLCGRGRWCQGQRYTASCAAHQLYDDTMVDAGARIGIAAYDRLLVRLLDPIERGKGRARKIIDQKTIRSWYEKNAMRRARRVAIAAHD